MAIRSYRPDDRAAVYDICLRTGDAGSDASHLVSHPDLPGHVYAGPYLALCRELAFVLVDGGGVAGYFLAARHACFSHEDAGAVFFGRSLPGG